MDLRIRLFAAAADAAGVRNVTLQVPDHATIEQALEALAGEYPGLAPLLPRASVARNMEYVGRDETLAPGDELAIIPPVSGGAAVPGPRPEWPGETAPQVAITCAPLALEPLVALVEHPLAGAVVTFAGHVRAKTGDEETVALLYESYAEMAEARMRDIAAEVAARWLGAKAAMAHRVGLLKPGELAVAVAVSAPHRGEAFEACRHVIEAIKTDVPIWKKEIRPDGREEWVGHA